MGCAGPCRPAAGGRRPAPPPRARWHGRCWWPSRWVSTCVCVWVEQPSGAQVATGGAVHYITAGIRFSRALGGASASCGATRSCSWPTRLQGVLLPVSSLHKVRCDTQPHTNRGASISPPAATPAHLDRCNADADLDKLEQESGLRAGWCAMEIVRVLLALDFRDLPLSSIIQHTPLRRAAAQSM